MPSISGQVTAVSAKERNTKHGVKNAYSFKIGTEWFNSGFKSLVAKGDVVEFEYTVGTFGNDVDAKSLRKVSGATADDPRTPTHTAPFKPSVGHSGGSGRAFPIPPLDGARSIVRQSSVKNALEFLDGCYDNDDNNMRVQEVLHFAKIFEAYGCGDSDLEEAKKEIEK